MKKVFLKIKKNLQLANYLGKCAILRASRINLASIVILMKLMNSSELWQSDFIKFIDL